MGQLSANFLAPPMLFSGEIVNYAAIINEARPVLTQAKLVLSESLPNESQGDRLPGKESKFSVVLPA